MTSGMDAVLAYEKWMQLPRRRDAARVDRRLQRGGLPRDARAARLARRAPSRGQGVGGGRRSRRRNRKEDSGEREALRQRLIDGEEPGSVRWLAGELLEYHRREARPGVVVVLRAPRPHDRRGAARRRRVDRRPRADGRDRCRQPVRAFIRCGFRRSSTSCRRASSSSIPRPRSRRARSSPSTTSPARSAFVAGRACATCRCLGAIAPGGPYKT